MLSLLKNINDYQIILASQSPRRNDLLNMIRLKFKVQPSDVEEKNHNNLSPVDYAMQNAEAKGTQVAARFPDAIVISADTIVVLDDKIIEKPKNEKNAFELISLLCGKKHEVITAFGILHHNKNKSVFDHEKTIVKFRDLSREEIRAYVETGESLDKAGGYGAQGVGSLIIEKVDGCFYNVVGFPLGKFFDNFRQFLNDL